MKSAIRILLLAVALAAMSHGTAWAAHRLTGFGVILGNISGVTFKQYLNRHLAFDLAFGAPNGYNVSPGVGSHADVMWADEIQPVSHGALLYYFGAGAGMAAGTTRNREVESSVRAVGGLEFFFPDSPFAVFGELGPGFVLAGTPGGRFNLEIGVRFYL